MSSFFNRNRAPSRPVKRSPTPTGQLTRKDSVGSEPPSPSTHIQSGPKPLYLSRPFVDAALVKGNFKTIVMQPKYVDVNEWVAVNSEPAPSLRCCASSRGNCYQYLTFIPT
ncbi:hypothetical protein GGX14DRAFT_475018 [Mycena pura]|uniref:Uncharacterized protein n=1 Tax=Mycena pura TaxID=153505 RepID=A0AAD6Y261_9AGAR|nr:hypothetical protein GGX14DRAFT_475018 [Mycena pura]